MIANTKRAPQLQGAQIQKIPAIEHKITKNIINIQTKRIFFDSNQIINSRSFPFKRKMNINNNTGRFQFIFRNDLSKVSNGKVVLISINNIKFLCEVIKYRNFDYLKFDNNFAPEPFTDKMVVIGELEYYIDIPFTDGLLK